MANILICPSKYIQGINELQNIAAHVSAIGKNFYIMVSESGLRRVKETLEMSFSKTDAKVFYQVFNGECSQNEIKRHKELMQQAGCDAVIGIGGGKILDTAKALAYYANTSVAIVPTIASTDAPTSALSVIYTDDGLFESYLFLPRNPDVVLLDTKIISKAPARLLVAGMGDALATYFEARTSIAASANNFANAKPTNAAVTLAKLCYEILIADGLKAKVAIEANVLTKSVENIIEANTLLSGLGFESCGLAASHSVHNGFTALEECHHLYHGEKVAFGVLTQLVLENADLSELEEVIHFCMSVGLPTTLAEMGIQEINQEKIMKVATLACAEGETIHNTVGGVTPEAVYAAILAADAMGKYYKNQQ